MIYSTARVDLPELAGIGRVWEVSNGAAVCTVAADDAQQAAGTAASLLRYEVDWVREIGDTKKLLVVHTANAGWCLVDRKVAAYPYHGDIDG